LPEETAAMQRMAERYALDKPLKRRSTVPAKVHRHGLEDFQFVFARLQTRLQLIGSLQIPGKSEVASPEDPTEMVPRWIPMHTQVTSSVNLSIKRGLGLVDLRLSRNEHPNRFR
jgi:hypothetical protein